MGGLKRPMGKGNRYSFLSLELQTSADVAFYLRNTERYVYEMILVDYPVLLAHRWQSSERCGSVYCSAGSSTIQLAYGLLLVLGCTLDTILRIYDGEVAQSVTGYHLFSDDTIVLAKNPLRVYIYVSLKMDLVIRRTVVSVDDAS